MNQDNSDMSVFISSRENNCVKGSLLPISSSSLIHDSEDHYLLDMDKIRKDNDNYSRKHKKKKKFPLGDDNDIYYENSNWSNKLIINWNQEDTINWLMYAALYLGQSYSSIQHSLAIPGKDLILLSKQDFLIHDPDYGDKLYDLLHSQRTDNYLPHFASIHNMPNRDDEKNFNAFLSDAESDNSVDVSRKSYSEKCKIQKCRKTQPTQGKLWEFIRDLLRNRETCPSLICWEDYSQAKFRFVRSDEVARRWGSRKGNTRMTYEKLSRAMRYYYKSKIFLPVLGRRLVYQFGPNAKGWQTDNPNFRR
ncbi:ETS-related transcription factor Elf-5-like [Chelonus insularis]|uniref:ETS-related transcription factor Elf-5-like n=1 Tax=Chelonus insularis TaxID=460826 RepID=UPI00158B99A1|nr:ETS-related transcription factor Elf-5-like [Chelonus insularis]